MKTNHRLGIASFLLISLLSVNNSCRQVSKSESETNKKAETVENNQLKEAVQQIHFANFSIQQTAYTSYDDEEAVEVVYPQVKTLDSSMSQLVNGTIQSKVVELFGNVVNSPAKGQKKKKKVNNDASQHYLQYTVDFANEWALSLTLKESNIACCGAAGSEHAAYPFTFDLKQRQLLTIGNIIEPTELDSLKNVVYHAAKNNEEVSPSALETMKALIGDIGNSSFQLHKEGVRLLLPNFGGYWASYITVDINFADYPGFFKEEIIALVSAENK